MGKYKLSSNVAISENGFMFSPTTGESFTLNPMGKLILEEIKSEKDSEDIIKLILEEYDIDKASAERDFTDFINQLQNHKLVTEL